MAEASQKKLEMPKHGEFCWTEIGVNELDKCEDFYKKVFGWQTKDSENSTLEGRYIEFDTGDGFTTGGIYALTKEMKESGLPPHIINYISVQNIEASSEKIKELGGTIMVEVQEIPDTGKMLFAQDTTGAMFALIELLPMEGDAIPNRTNDKHGQVCWYELTTREMEKLICSIRCKSVFPLAPPSTRKGTETLHILRLCMPFEPGVPK